MNGDVIEPSEVQMLLDAEEGLGNGDLVPLAALLRSGHPIRRFLRIAIADAIEGNGAYQPLKLNHRAGWRPTNAKQRAFRQMLDIGEYIEKELNTSKRGAFIGIVKDAAILFKVSEGQVKACYTRFKKRKSPNMGMSEAEWQAVAQGLRQVMNETEAKDLWGV